MPATGLPRRSDGPGACWFGAPTSQDRDQQNDGHGHGGKRNKEPEQDGGAAEQFDQNSGPSKNGGGRNPEGMKDADEYSRVMDDFCIAVSTKPNPTANVSGIVYQPCQSSLTSRRQRCARGFMIAQT
jgi:hypothetical protein